MGHRPDPPPDVESGPNPGGPHRRGRRIGRCRDGAWHSSSRPSSRSCCRSRADRSRTSRSPCPVSCRRSVSGSSPSCRSSSIPVLIAVLTRSMSLAFLLTVLFFVADLALTGSAQFWQASPVPWVPAVTVTGSISRLLLGVRGSIPGLTGAAVGLPGRAARLVGPAGCRRDRTVPAHRHQRIGGAAWRSPRTHWSSSSWRSTSTS